MGKRASSKKRKPVPPEAHVRAAIEILRSHLDDLRVDRETIKAELGFDILGACYDLLDAIEDEAAVGARKDLQSWWERVYLASVCGQRAAEGKPLPNGDFWIVTPDHVHKIARSDADAAMSQPAS